ncbi:MAG TPA: hypothetical protein QGG47_09460 [Acidobacteriota bacterium]|nr:hypothetical protein [Acidobacteriota bacterium]
MRATRLLLLAWATLACGCATETAPAVRMANVKQLMGAVIEPAAEVYWDAVGAIIDENGLDEFAPSSPNEWAAVRNSALVLAESGDLLMVESRAVDQETWATLSLAMNEAGSLALAAADAQDPDAVFDAGAEVYFACAACHAAYAPEIVRPSDVRDE